MNTSPVPIRACLLAMAKVAWRPSKAMLVCSDAGAPFVGWNRIASHSLMIMNHTTAETRYERGGLASGAGISIDRSKKPIAHLDLKASQTKGGEKIEEVSQIKELERRRKMQEGRLIDLNREGAGPRQDMKAGIETLADDLSGAAEDFFLWIDSDYHPDRHPNRP